MSLFQFFACLLPVLLVLLLWSRTSTHLRQVEPSAYRRTPRWLLPLVVAGAAGGGLWFAVLGISLRRTLEIPGAANAEGIVQLLVSVAMDAAAEELGKVALLALLIALGTVPDRLRALLLGLLAGASFAFVENLLFLTVAAGERGAQDPSLLMLLRLPVSTVLHPAASGLVASASWSLFRSGPDATSTLQALAAIVAAWALHGGWNLALRLSDSLDAPALALAGLLVPLGAGVIVALDLARLTRKTRKALGAARRSKSA